MLYFVVNPGQSVTQHPRKGIQGYIGLTNELYRLETAGSRTADMYLLALSNCSKLVDAACGAPEQGLNV